MTIWWLPTRHRSWCGETIIVLPLWIVMEILLIVVDRILCTFCYHYNAVICFFKELRCLDVDRTDCLDDDEIEQTIWCRCIWILWITRHLFFLRHCGFRWGRVDVRTGEWVNDSDIPCELLVITAGAQPGFLRAGARIWVPARKWGPKVSHRKI